MLFYSFLKTQFNKNVEITLKNNLNTTGTLLSVDPFLNLKLENVIVKNQPGLTNLGICSIRGSSVKFIMLNKEEIELNGLHDASRYRLSSN